MNKITPSPKDVADNKIIAAISYISILCLVSLLLKKDSPFTMFHAKQGLALFIIEIVAGLIMWIPVLNLISAIVYLICFIVSIYGIMQVFQGKTEPLPVLSQMVEKLN